MAESNSGIEDKNNRNNQPDAAPEATLEQDSDLDSSFESSLKLSEDTEDGSDDSGFNQDSDSTEESSSETQEATEKTDLSESPDLQENIEDIFESVDEAMSESQATTLELRRYLAEVGRSTQRQVGSDSDGNLETVEDPGHTGVMKFDLLEMNDSDYGDVSTKIYENGGVLTTLGDGTKLRFASPESENAGVAEVTFTGEEVTSGTHEEANVTLSNFDAQGISVSRNADATLRVDYSEPQPDGATSMTIFPRNSDGKKWERNVPRSDDSPGYSVIAYENGTRTINFDEPLEGVTEASQTESGNLLATTQRTFSVQDNGSNGNGASDEGDAVSSDTTDLVDGDAVETFFVSTEAPESNETVATATETDQPEGSEATERQTTEEAPVHTVRDYPREQEVESTEETESTTDDTSEQPQRRPEILVRVSNGDLQIQLDGSVRAQTFQNHPFEREQAALGLVVPRSQALSLDSNTDSLLSLNGSRESRPLSMPERIMRVSPFILNQSSVFVPNQHLHVNPFSAHRFNSSGGRLQGVQLGGGEGSGFHLGGIDGQRIPGQESQQSLFDRRSPAFDLLSLGHERPSFRKEPEWLPAGEAVAKLSGARNSVEAYTALRELTELSRNGDEHATTALAATLVALTNGGEGLTTLQGLQHRGEPMLAPNLANLSDADKRYMKTAIMSELGKGMQLGRIADGISLGQIQVDSMPINLRISNNLPREAVLALSTAFTSENTQEADRMQIESILRAQAHTDDGAYAIFHASRSGVLPQNEKLDQMLVEGMEGRRGDYFLDRLEDGVEEGNKHDIDLVAKAMGRDDLSSSKVDRSFDILRNAAKNGQADQVLKSLLETHEQYGDNGQILNCLGALVQDGSLSEAQNETVMNVLREGINSDVPSTQKSAVEGFMRNSSRWTESDLQILADNICPATAEGLRDIGDQINPEQASQLANLIEQNIRDNDYQSPVEKTAAATALGALAEHTSATAPEALKDMITSTDLEDKDAQDTLVKAGVHSLMAIAGSRSEGHEQAASALIEPGWTNTESMQLESDSVRKELVDYVTGKITREEMSDASRPATYNSGFPQSIHSLFREEGAGANVVDNLVENARENYSDNEIRDIMSRVDLYNALPPQMRTEVFSGDSQSQEGESSLPQQVDSLVVLGQMANGTLAQSDNKILEQPIEDAVRSLRSDKAKERRATSREHRINDRETDQTLRTLTRETAEGVSTFDHFISIFGDDTLSNFRQEQISGLRRYQLGLEEGEALSSDISELNLEHQMLSAALDSQRYGDLRREGNEEGADKLALKMLRDYGRSLATISPEAWTDLGFESQGASSTALAGTTDGETVWQRLHRQGVGDATDTPSIIACTPQGLTDALKELSIDRDSDNIDTQTRRTLALQALDADSAVFNLSRTAADLQTQLPDIQRLVGAGLSGTRTETYAREVRESVQQLEELYTKMNTKDPSTGKTPAEMARESMEQMEEALPDLAPEMQSQVQKRVDAMKKMLEFFDKDSPQGMQMQLMFDQVGSNDFNASTFGNWLKTDGIKTLGAIGGAVLAAGAITLSCGTATPLVMVAAAAAATAGGIVGHELTAEAMYQLGTGERTGALIMHAGVRDGLMMGADGQAERMSVGGALGEYGKQFGYGFAISLATLGVGAVFKHAIVAARGGATGALSANSQGFARLASRISQVEQAVEKAGGQAVMKRWVAQMANEFKDELVEEGLGQSAEIGMEHLLGKVNPALTVLASALIANRKMGGNFDVQTRRNGSMEVEVNPDADTGVVMETLRTQLEADGLQVEYDSNNNSEMMVTTPEGDTMTLRLKPAETSTSTTEAGTDVAADTQVQEQAGAGRSDTSSRTDPTQTDPTQTEPTQTDSTNLEADSTTESTFESSADLEDGELVGVGADDGAQFELPKLSQNDVNAPLTETDARAQRLAQLERNLKAEPDMPEASRAEVQQEIDALKTEIVKDLRTEAANQLQRVAGLSPEQARQIVDQLDINLEDYSESDSAAGSFQSYSGALNMYMGADMPEGVRPHKTFIHEFTHELDAARNTALFNANPELYLENIVSDVMNNAFSGKQAIWNNPSARSQRDYLYTRLQEGDKGLTEADVTFAKEMLGKYLRQNISDGTLPEVPTEQELADWIKQQDAYFPDHRQENRLLREMVREISHAEVVLSESKFGSNALENQGIQDLVNAFESDGAGNDPTTYSHRLQGISSATTGLADPANYDFGSRYETRANRVQNRAIIESTHRAMPDLANQLNSQIEGNSEFEALNQKLDELIPEDASSDSRRTGVKLMEYFSSTEGRAHLEQLQANPATRELAQSIEGTVQARQEAIKAQRFATALDQLPARRQALDQAEGNADRAQSQEQFDRTVQSLMENAPDADLPRLIKHLNNEGLATGDDVLTALSANKAEALAGRDYSAVKGVVSSLNRTGVSPTQVISSLNNTNTANPNQGSINRGIVAGLADWDMNSNHISDLLTANGDIQAASINVLKALRPSTLETDLSDALKIAQEKGKLTEAFNTLEQNNLVNDAKLQELKAQFDGFESTSSESDNDDSGGSTVEDAFRAHNQSDLIDSIPDNLRNLNLESTEVAGSGAESLVFKIPPSDAYPNGGALKLTAATEGGFDSAWGTRPFDAKRIGEVHDLGDGHYLYVQESLDTNVSDNHPGWGKLEQQLQEQGYEWVDGGKNQVGINANGDLVILDYGAVKPAGEGSRYNMEAQAREAQIEQEESTGRLDDSESSEDYSDLSEGTSADVRELVENPPNDDWKTVLNEIYNQNGSVDDAVIARQIELNDFSAEAEARIRKDITDAQNWVDSQSRKSGSSEE